MGMTKLNSTQRYNRLINSDEDCLQKDLCATAGYLCNTRITGREHLTNPSQSIRFSRTISGWLKDRGRSIIRVWSYGPQMSQLVKPALENRQEDLHCEFEELDNIADLLPCIVQPTTFI